MFLSRKPKLSLLISSSPWSFILFCQWAWDAETQRRHCDKNTFVYPGVAGHVRRCRRIAAVASEDFLPETAYTVEVRSGPVHNRFPHIHKVALNGSFTNISLRRWQLFDAHRFTDSDENFAPRMRMPEPLFCYTRTREQWLCLVRGEKVLMETFCNFDH